MKSIHTAALTTLLALNLTCVGGAFASEDGKHHRSNHEATFNTDMAKQLGLISQESATQIALKSAPGVVREVELDDRKMGKGWKYEFEIVDANGHEWEVDIDAKSGEVLKSRKDWF